MRIRIQWFASILTLLLIAWPLFAQAPAPFTVQMPEHSLPADQTITRPICASATKYLNFPEDSYLIFRLSNFGTVSGFDHLRIQNPHDDHRSEPKTDQTIIQVEDIDFVNFLPSIGKLILAHEGEDLKRFQDLDELCFDLTFHTPADTTKTGVMELNINIKGSEPVADRWHLFLQN